MINEDTAGLQYYTLFSTAFTGLGISRWQFLSQSEITLGSQTMTSARQPLYYHQTQDGSVPIFSHRYLNYEDACGDIFCNEEPLSISYDLWSIQDGTIYTNHLPFRLLESDCREGQCDIHYFDLFFLQF